MKKLATIPAAAIAICAATALTPAFAAMPITNVIDGVEWRFMLDTPSGTNGTAMLGINPATSGSTNRENDSMHACPAASIVNAANIPWEFDYDGVHYTITRVCIGAFYKMTTLTGIITIPPAVTELRNNCFQGCTGLTYLKGGDSVKVWGTRAFGAIGSGLSGAYPDFSVATSIAEDVFSGAALTGTLKLGNNLTTLERVAFENCNFTGAAVVPSSVTQLGKKSDNGKNYYGVFMGCSNLEAIWVKGGTSDSTALTVQCGDFAKSCTSLKVVLMGLHTKGSEHTLTGYHLTRGDSGVEVFVPANGEWDGLVVGTNNKAWYYGPTNDFNLVVDDGAMQATFTPTTVETFTNALSWASLFKEHFDLDPRISVTNALDLTGVTITDDMVSGVTFDRLMFTVKTQAELEGILDVFPSDTPLAIDPSGITENLTIPVARKVFVQLSEADAVKLKAQGFSIIFR